MRVVRITFRLQYTNFILTIESGLDKVDKNENKTLFELGENCSKSKKEWEFKGN